MATKTSRPGRTLVIFGLIIVAMFAGAASLGSWKPKLGLDLQGGTLITLQARSNTGGSVTADKLNEAVSIISSRVNGAGVSEASVSTQGSDIIIVQIPGKVDKNLTRTIGSTAQLRFRLVAQEIGPASSTKPGQPGGPTSPAPTSPAPTSPGATPTPTSPAATSTVSPQPNGPTTSPTSSGSGRVGARWLLKPAAPATKPHPPHPTGPPAALRPPNLLTIKNPYQWVDTHSLAYLQQHPTDASAQTWLSKLESFRCPGSPGAGRPPLDLPSQPLLACDNHGDRYLLGPAMVEGTEVTNASAGIPQGGVNYVVNLQFNGTGAKKFGEVTTKIAQALGGPYAGKQLAIVLDGKVLSAPVNSEPILGGQAQISGSSANPFTLQSASSLANSLKYGALPLSFTIQGATEEGPQLAGNQLSAGIAAGVIGLILVVLYCILYYRGLSLVIIASLGIAGCVTYALILLLGHAYGFTMTLPGIAGFIVAVGITADSFIVYFERLRDEVREGRTLRTSVETGWVRARTTILAADAVSLLAALVLYIFAIGVVKGFAFALGLSTVIDVFVVFFWSKPMVTLLSRTAFFGHGHKLSGLDRGHLGVGKPRRTVRPAGGEA